MTLIYLYKIIILNHLEPRCSGRRTVFQSWDLPLTIKKMDWSQAEQGRAETLHLLVTNPHGPAFMQHRKEKVGSCLEDLEIQVPQAPELAPSQQRGCSRQPGHPAARGMNTSNCNQNPGKKGLICKSHELNP